MRTLTTTTAALGIIAAILAGPAARPAQAVEPVTTFFVLAGAAAGGAVGAKLGAGVGIAALGGAVNGAWAGGGTGALAGSWIGLGTKAALAKLGALAPATKVAIFPAIMTPGGAVVIGGVLVVGVTAGYVIANWKTIGPELAELRDEMLSGLDTAWHATADAGIWMWDGTKAVTVRFAEATADAGVVAWNAAKDAAEWTADAAVAGGAATWNGTKAAAGWTADITVAGANETWKATKASGRWAAGVGRALGTGSGLLWDAITMQTPDAAALLPPMQPTMPMAGIFPAGR